MNGLSLGIPGVGAVSPGTHFCALYSGPAERDRLLFPFLEEGLRHGDKCLCLIDDVEPALVRDRAVGQPGPDYSRRSAQLDVERSSDAYLRSGEFSVEDMVSFLAERVDAAIADDFDLLRAAGEMSWVLSGAPGWDDLFVYESSLNFDEVLPHYGTRHGLLPRAHIGQNSTAWLSPIPSRPSTTSSAPTRPPAAARSSPASAPPVTRPCRRLR